MWKLTVSKCRDDEDGGDEDDDDDDDDDGTLEDSGVRVGVGVGVEVDRRETLLIADNASDLAGSSLRTE